jgi:hypothetical protein
MSRDLIRANTAFNNLSVTEWDRSFPGTVHKRRVCLIKSCARCGKRYEYDVPAGDRAPVAPSQLAVPRCDYCIEPGEQTSWGWVVTATWVAQKRAVGEHL